MAYELKKLTPNLVVGNVERSLAFYCDVLGLTEFAFEDPDGYVITFAER